MYILFSLSWSYGSWIYNYLCNTCLSSLKVWIRFPLWRGVLDTTLCDKVGQWLATGRWFYLGTPLSSTNKTDRHENNSNIVESGVKHNNHTTSYALIILCESSSLHISLYISSHHNSVKAGWDFLLFFFLNNAIFFYI